MIEIRKFEPDDTDAAVKIWNEVVDDGKIGRAHV